MSQPSSGPAEVQAEFLLLVTILGTLLVLVTGLSLVVVLGPRPAPPDPVQIRSAYIYPVSEFAPESRERIGYVLGLGIVFVVPFVLDRVLRTRPAIWRDAIPPDRLPRYIEAASWVASIALVTAFLGPGFLWNSGIQNSFLLSSGFVYLRSTFAAHHPLVGLAVILPSCWWWNARPHIPDAIVGRASRGVRVLGRTVTVGLVLCITFMEIFDEHALLPTWDYVHHLSSFIGSVVSVTTGKTLLVDLYNTYGLYPHLLEPITRALGGNLLLLTSLFGALTAVSLVFVYLTLRRVLQTAWLRYFAFASLVYFTFFVVGIAEGDGPHPPYFQYNPLRVLFPCMALWLSERYDGRQTRRLRMCLYVLPAVAILWNLDSGLAVLLCCLAALVYGELRKGAPARALLARMAQHAAGVALAGVATVLAYSGFTLVRAGRLPDPSWFFKAANSYYGSGFMMMPLPAFHPWLIVIGSYVVGICFAMSRVAYGHHELHEGLIFSCSALGLGAFVYYQGRSHDFNLPAVWYPALILGSVLLDRFLVAQRNHAWFGYRPLATCVFALFLTGSASLLSATRSIVHASASGVSLARTGRTPEVVTNTDFLRRASLPKRGVLILSHFAWYYHWETGIRTPLRFAALADVVLRRDFEDILEAIQSRETRWVVLDVRFIAFPYVTTTADLRARALNLVVRDFRAVSGSPNGELTLFERK